MSTKTLTTCPVCGYVRCDEYTRAGWGDRLALFLSGLAGALCGLALLGLMSGVIG